MQFGLVLSLKRKEKNLKQEDVAKIVGYSRASIANMEMCIQEPSLTIAIRLSKLLGFSLDDLSEFSRLSRKDRLKIKNDIKINKLKKQIEELTTPPQGD